MLPFAYYLLKVIICSGILYGYYLLALRNKIFHRWNRFYLLSAVVLSLAIPLIKINILQKAEQPTTGIQLLQAVSTGDEIVFEYTNSNSNLHIDAANFFLFIYIIVSGLLSGFLIQTLLKISRLRKNNRQSIIAGVNFINTNVKGTPFSFFNTIFWNDKIDINTATGKQIFKHEVAHVQEKHSYDKIFTNIVLIFFWCNPFFWLIRKELNIIHEFIADKKALEDSDTAAFAAMILQATYPHQNFNITNNFFYSPLKRRLAMLIKNKNPKINYASRVLALPLAALVFFAFTLKMKTINKDTQYAGKIITVVIDAGHGGDDNGVIVDNIKEKNLTLSIAKEIKAMNKNENINIILSREQDQKIDVKDRVKIAIANKADLFISLHIDAASNNNTISGLNILIPNNDNLYVYESKMLGSSLMENFKNNYGLSVANDVRQREKGVWVLKANQYPSVLVEAGMLTNKKDMEYLIEPANQKIIARNILKGIEKYAQQNFSIKKNNAFVFADTIATFQTSKNDFKNAVSINSFERMKNISEKNKKSDTIPNKSNTTPSIKGKNVNIPIYDSVGNVIGQKTINLPATDKEVNRVPIIFTKVEVDPSFPGGEQAWTRYVKKIIENNIQTLLQDNKSGTCRIRFIVNADSTISEINVMSMQGTRLAEIAINAIKKGPKWNPARQNGHIVSAYREQPITFIMKEQ